MQKSTITSAIYSAYDKPERKIMRLGILTPSFGAWASLFGSSLATMHDALRKIPVPGYDGIQVHGFTRQGSILPRVRQLLVDQALAAGMTHLLFLDADMVFPGDLVHRLAQHGKEIVVANYSCKTLPPEGVVRVFDASGRLEKIDPVQEVGGLHEVAVGGLGVALIEAQVFRKLAKPWFAFEWKPSLLAEYPEEDGIWDFQPEDYYLFLKAREAGFRVWCDLDASKEIGHVGSYVYTLADDCDTRYGTRFTRG